MLQLTFPIVVKSLLRHKLGLLTLVLLSILLGIVPTLQSELESGVIQQTSETLSALAEPEGEPQGTELMYAVLGTSIDRFEGTRPNAGVPERLAVWLFQGINFLLAIFWYLVIVAVAFGINLVAKSIQAAVSKDMFAELRGVGMRKGLTADTSAMPAMSNAAGQYAIAIQQGAANVGRTYTYVLEAGQHLFALATTIVLVWTQSWVFGLFCALVVANQIWISRIQARRLALKREALDAARNNLVGQSDDILSKREILLAFEQQGPYGDKLDRITREYAEIERDLAVAEKVYGETSELISTYGRILILLGPLIAALYLGRSQFGNVGDAYFLIAVYARILSPASQLLWRYDRIKRSESTSRTFLGVLEQQDAELPHDEEGALRPAPHWKPAADIRFADASFGYTDEAELILKNCTCTIPAGKTTLLLGPSGSGKSTMAKILLGFWPLSSGRIEIGGGEIRDFSPTELRLQMSYVAQASHIVDDTVEENLKWGHSENEITESDMYDALSAVGVDNVANGADILKTPARDLSTGQQKRLSIARMMLDESEIVILDEPMAGVDVFTIRDLLPVLKRLLDQRNHTVLMISHNLAFAAHADHVIVLNENGEVIEEGDRKSLYEQNGVFADLYRISVEELSYL